MQVFWENPVQHPRGDLKQGDVAAHVSQRIAYWRTVAVLMGLSSDGQEA